MILFIFGFVLGEILSSYLPLALPKSGALDVATQKFQLGLESLTLDLFFVILEFGFKIKASALGIICALLFAVIGRYL